MISTACGLVATYIVEKYPDSIYIIYKFNCTIVLCNVWIDIRVLVDAYKVYYSKPGAYL